MACATNISRVMDIVSAALQRDRVVLVCSAISGCTDALLSIGRRDDGWQDKLSGLQTRHHDIITRLFTGAERSAAIEECDATIRDINLSTFSTETFGEILSTRIIARKFECDGVPTVWIDSRKTVHKGDLEATYRDIKAAVDQRPETRLFVAPGFIASQSDGRPTTLGRGGSDYSAALYAAGVGAVSLEIWTDVPGIMTTNPKDAPAARTIPTMSYKTALDLARFGAKVLYPPTVEPARLAGIPIRILNSFNPSQEGTLVRDYDAAPHSQWMGVTSMKVERGSLISLVGEGTVYVESANARIGKCLWRAGIKAIETSHEEGIFHVLVNPAEELTAIRAIHAEFFETHKIQLEMMLFKEILERDSTSGSERPLAEWLLENLEAPKKESFEVGDGTINLLFSWGDKPKVVYCTHMDTVPPYIAPVFEGDVVQGRGACDAKGQLFAMYSACKSLEAKGYTDFALLLVSGEETGSWGAKAFAKTPFRAPLLVIGEPTENKMISSCKGTKSFDVRFQGEACHSGYPELGRSAVEMFLEFMNELHAADLAGSTFNVGQLVSDNPQNILSPELSCRIYFRTTAKGDALVREFMSRDREGVSVTARGGDTPAEYYTIEGFESTPGAFGSDAPHLTNFEKKIICGPGSISVAHRDNEYVLLSDINKAIDIYTRIYESCN